MSIKRYSQPDTSFEPMVCKDLGPWVHYSDAADLESQLSVMVVQRDEFHGQVLAYRQDYPALLAERNAAHDRIEELEEALAAQHALLEQAEGDKRKIIRSALFYGQGHSCHQIDVLVEMFRASEAEQEGGV
jgi:hypothetical protein